MSDTQTPAEKTRGRDFIRDIVAGDLAEGRRREVVTRFPPEPNGYLHIGHAKSVCLNFGIAQEFGGRCYLRFDDTNPSRESTEFVESMKEDVRWLGFTWHGEATHASDYFERLYEFAEALVTKGRAYVDSASAEQIRADRGTLTTPGRASPHRDRTVQENLDLLRRMRAGEFADGAHVLRARIDMASPNLTLRDPVMYRIMHREHQMSGDRWCIYPLYDFAHGQCDYLEGVTHSLCTLEFEDHRPLYEWFLDALELRPQPRQYEFSRLNLSYTVTSKRRLTALVHDGHVSGWDNPRMPTVKGLRRRGFTPESIRDFCERIGVTRKDNVVDMAVLENCIREDLDRRAPRALGVLRPLKLTLIDYPEDAEEQFEVPNHPRDPAMGTRQVPFSRDLLIEAEDFMEDPPGKFFRLAPGREVRLKYAYLVRCEEVVKDPVSGEVVELICRHDPDSGGGNAPDGRKVKGTLHWVSARHAQPARVHLYDRLFDTPAPAATDHPDGFIAHLNPDSQAVVERALLEPSLAQAAPGHRFQLERLGFFCIDEWHDGEGLRVNRTVTLRDSWAKARQRGG